MKLRILLTALLALTPVVDLSAGEVSLDTVTTTRFNTVSTTRHAVRGHGAYFGVFGGGGQLGSATLRGRGTEDFSPGQDSLWFAGIKAGYSFALPIPVRPSLELEATYIDGQLNASQKGRSLRSDFIAVPLMVNFILALDLDHDKDGVDGFWSCFKPYLGAGAGISYVEQSNTVFERGSQVRPDGDKSSFTPAYQVFGGVEYSLSDDFSIYAEYKRLFLEEFGSENVSNGELSLWTVGFKLQY